MVLEKIHSELNFVRQHSLRVWLLDVRGVGQDTRFSPGCLLCPPFRFKLFI